jgi:HEAT repeat protein
MLRVAFVALFTVTAVAMTCTAADPSPEFAKAKATINRIAEEDGKLRAQYRETIVEGQKLTQLNVSRAAAKGTKDKDKIDRDIRPQKAAFEKHVSAFKKHQAALLATLKDDGTAAITDLGRCADPESVTELIRVLELFVFDSKNEVAELKASSSFIDQPSWSDAVAALGKKGVAAVPALAKSLPSGSYASRIGAAKALGIIGPDADKADPKIHQSINEMHTKIFSSSLDRTERERRCKILKDAMAGLKPAK